MSFTVTYLIGRVPTISELQALAKEHGVQITGDEQAGIFSHPKASGKYTFAKDGEIHGEFTGQHVAGSIIGIFVFMSGKAEVTISKSPFLIPDAILRSSILEGLKVFCAKFPPLA